MLWNAHVCFDGLVATVNEVLLSKLKQKVCTEFDVEVNVAIVSFGLTDVRVQSLVEQLDGLFFVVFVSPSNDCF